MNAQVSPELVVPNVLIIDDSVFDRARLRRTIQVAGIRCAIQEVENLLEADAALEFGVFDLAILDYDLPDGTGHDAIRLLQRSYLNSQTAMVMITGNQSARVSKVALELGCIACISKDRLSPDNLKCAFAEALSRTGNRVHAPASPTASRTVPEFYTVK